MGLVTRWRKWPLVRWLLVLAAVAQAAPVWAVRYLATQDGPAHVENSVILRKLVMGDETVARSYRINPRPVPNWTGHAILAALTTMMSPRVAEKVLVSLCVIGLPLAAGYAGAGVRRGGEWVGFVALPFAYSVALHKGLYNFCLSLSVFFVLIGYAIRHFATMRGRDVAMLMLLALLLYFSHVVSLIVALAVLGGLGAGAFICGQRRQLPLFGLAVVPAVALVIWFLATSEGGASDQRSIGVQLLRFFELDALVSLRKPELLIAIALAGVLWLTTAALAVRKIVLKHWEGWDGLLLIALALVVLYVFAPNSAAGGGQISFRLSLYPYFMLMMWMAGQQIARTQAAAVAVCAVVVATMLMGVRWSAYRKMSREMTEYVSVADALETGKSVIAIDASREAGANSIERRVRPFWHAMGYVAAERGVWDLGNYEQKMGYFPVISPGIWSMSSSSLGDRVTDDERYAMGTGADYVVVWSVAPEKVGVSVEVSEWLKREYDVVYTSAPSGCAVVWRKKR